MGIVDGDRGWVVGGKVGPSVGWSSAWVFVFVFWCVCLTASGCIRVQASSRLCVTTHQTIAYMSGMHSNALVGVVGVATGGGGVLRLGWAGNWSCE